ncbi:MAG: radical SAM/SPASM domain-containing protein [Candidatus Hydrogenedentota bacterium]
MAVNTHGAADSKFARIQQWQRGETPGPWEMQVHPTNRCNLKCKICWERRAEIEIGPSIYDKRQEVSDARYLHLVDEAAELGVREWSIVGGGEPMVRADLVLAMCERICARGMNGAVHTNATRFKPEHFDRLIAAGWWQINLSLDGPNQELNDAIRGGGFEKAVANIKLLNQMKREAGAGFPRVRMNPVITNITWDRLEELVDLAHELECECLGFSHLVFESDDEPGTAFRLNAEQMRQTPAMIARAAERAKELGLHSNFTSFETGSTADVGAHAIGRTRYGDGRMSDANCFETWLSCVVHVDGRVGPCCVSYEADSDNIKDASLRDVWLGPYMQSVRERITGDNLMSYCAGCPTYITPRTEEIRHELSRQRWREWAAMPLGERLRLAAGVWRENLRQRGLRATLGRAWRWVRVRKARREAAQAATQERTNPQ